MTIRSGAELMAMAAVDSIQPMPLPAPVFPKRPDGFVIDLLHRGHDAMVSYARKVNGVWQELGSEPAAYRCGLFADEAKAEAMKVDSYFGLHGVWEKSPHKPMPGLLPGLQPLTRGSKQVQYLTCFHVDLDVYRTAGMDSHDAIAAVNRMVEEGRIPSPSLYTMTNGAWAIWRLHDRLHKDQPLRNHPDHITRRWTALQEILHSICSHIGSDRNALDSTRMHRIPGSVSSKGGKRVGYLIPASIDGQLFSYTLEDMESLLSPYRAKRLVPFDVKKHIPDEKRSLIGKQGCHSRWQLLLDRLDKLRQMRGGWQEGTRDSAIKFVLLAAGHMGMGAAGQDALIRQHRQGMAQPRERPYTEQDAKSRGRWVGRKQASLRAAGEHIGTLRNQTVADALRVTPDEAAILSANCRNPFPAASSHPALPTLSKAEATKRRRVAVERICGGLRASGIVPNGTYLRAVLAAEGLEATLKTVLKDMAAVGYPSPMAHQKKRAENQRLPGF